MHAKLAAAAYAGFTGVEICQADLDASGMTPAETAGMAARLGLEVCAYQPLRDYETTSPERAAANWEHARAAVGTAAGLGARVLIVCSSTAADAPRDTTRTADQLLRLAHLAGDAGLRIGYEALSWGTWRRRWQDAWEVVAAAGCPLLGLVLDSFHALAGRDGLAGIAELPAEFIAGVQLADAPLSELPLREWSRHHRCFPGQGRLDVTSFTRAVRATGYAGPLGLEIFSDRLRRTDPVLAAGEAMASLCWLGDQTGRQLAAT
jgi:4-hydroxyphenylpyruvate dioxygenase